MKRNKSFPRVFFESASWKCHISYEILMSGAMWEAIKHILKYTHFPHSKGDHLSQFFLLQNKIVLIVRKIAKSVTSTIISVKHTGTHTFSEKVWVLVYSWSLYIQTRNIQGLTPFQNVLEKCQIWKGVSSCMFLQLMSFGQEHTRTYTFSRFFENRVTSSGVSPCMFHVCIYKNQEHTRSHTFSKNHENFLKTYKNSHLFNSFHFNQTTIKLFVDGTP